MIGRQHMGENKQDFERAQRVIPGGVNSPVRAFRAVGRTPRFIREAKGDTITDVEGNTYTDYVMSWGPLVLGHACEEVVRAVTDAARKGLSYGAPTGRETELAEEVRAACPHMELVRLVNSGTEATMSCVRLARGFTGRDKIVKFEGCYHGHVDSLLVRAGSGALTFGNPDSAGVPEDLAKLTCVLDFNDFDAAEKLFEREGGNIACVIMEPYPANVGLILPKPGFLEHVRRLCARHGALLIFDEVITGFRMAKGGAQEYSGVTPDLCALGKIIGGGLPVGAFCGRAEIMQKLAPLGLVYQAGTLSGNPLAMAAGIAALKLIRELNPYAELEEKAKFLVAAADGAARRKGVDLQIPRAASLFSFFFNSEEVSNCKIAMKSSRELYAKFFRSCLDAGLYFAPSPFEICFVSAAHTREHLERAAEIISKSIASL